MIERTIIASRTQVSIYSYSSKIGFELIKRYKNPLGRLKNKAMRNDAPGMSRAKYKEAAPHSLGSEKSQHDEAADQFIRDISKELKRDLKQINSLHLRVVAEGTTLGLLKKHMQESYLDKRIKWIEKNIEKIPMPEWPRLIGLPPLKIPEEKAVSRFPI